MDADNLRLQLQTVGCLSVRIRHTIRNAEVAYDSDPRKARNYRPEEFKLRSGLLLIKGGYSCEVPPGRFRFVANPSPIGSTTTAKTIGMR